MTRVHHVAVVGGGIAGPVCALALLRAGMNPTVYEAHNNTADGVGGTLALAPNGVAALHLVDAADAVVGVSRAVPRMAMTIGARHRFDLPTLPDVGPTRVVRRADLYRVLRDRLDDAGIPVRHGKRLTSVDVDAGTAVFGDGEEVRADVIVGADGIHSIVRGAIDPSAPGPRYTGMLGIEGLSTLAAIDNPDVMTFAFGRRAYYLYWREGDSTRWGVNLPHPQPMPLVEARRLPAVEWRRRLLTVYGDDEPGGALITSTDPATFQVSGSLQIMPRVPRWHRGRAVLVGDAVHAPSNSSGQGASLAIESAVELARCLRDADDHTEAFAVYERLRRGRVERVAARAAATNRAKAPGAVGRAVMPLLMPLFTRTVMRPDRALGPEQRYRIDWDAPAR